MAIKIGSFFKSILSYTYSGLNYRKVNNKLGPRYYTDGLSCRRLALLTDPEMDIFRGILDQAEDQKLINVAAKPVRINTTWLMHRFALREMIAEAEDLQKLDHTRLIVRAARFTNSTQYALDLDHVCDEIHSALVSQQTTMPAAPEEAPQLAPAQPLVPLGVGEGLSASGRTDTILRGMVELSEVFSGLTDRTEIFQTVRRIFHRDRDLVSLKEQLAAVEVTILVPDGDGKWRIDVPERGMRTAFENRFLATAWGQTYLEGAPPDEVLRSFLHGHEVASGVFDKDIPFQVEHLNLNNPSDCPAYESDFAVAHLDQFEGSPEMGVVVMSSTARDFKSHTDAIILFHNRQCSLRTDLGSPLPVETQQFRYHLLFERAAQALQRVRTAEEKMRITSEQSAVTPLPTESEKPKSKGPGWFSWSNLSLKAMTAYYAIKAGITRSNPDEGVALVRFENASGQTIVGIADPPENVRKGERAPWVIVPPAYGKRKETYFLLAQYLTKNGIGVLRYDDSNSVGESDGEIENLTLSQSRRNIDAAIDYVERNCRAGSIGLIPFSLATTPAIVAAKEDQRVQFLDVVVGAPNVEDLLTRVWGANLVEAYRLGHRREGLINVLGFPIRGDEFLNDAISGKFTNFELMCKHLAELEIPIVWHLGEDDPWVNRQEVSEALREKPEGQMRDRHVVPGLGHKFREAEKAQEVFAEIVRSVRKMCGMERASVVAPTKAEVVEKAVYERGRIKEVVTKEQSVRNWRSYLVEGFDILLETAEYRQLMDDQFHAVGFQPGETLVDFGAGTGNSELSLAAKLIDTHPIQAIGGKVVALDLVEDALGMALDKWERAESKCPHLPELEAHSMDLDISPLRSMLDHLEGRIEYEDFSARFPDLRLPENPQVQTRKNIKKLIRGQIKLEEGWVYGTCDPASIQDLDLAARFLRGELIEEDLNESGREKGLDYKTLSCADLNFKRLDLGEVGRTTRLDFADESADKTLGSLFLSYLDNPEEVVSEMVRMTRKGGRVVLSSLLPDADLSRIFSNYLNGVIAATDPGPERESRLQEGRNLLNNALSWIEHSEESGLFKYYTPEELRQLLEDRGCRDVEVKISFGGQAVIVSGTPT